MNSQLMKAPKENGTLILKRSFNQSDFRGGYIKYWRIMTPSHPNFMSDISLLWLKENNYVNA